MEVRARNQDFELWIEFLRISLFLVNVWWFLNTISWWEKYCLEFVSHSRLNRLRGFASKVQSIFIIPFIKWIETPPCISLNKNVFHFCTCKPNLWVVLMLFPFVYNIGVAYPRTTPIESFDNWFSKNIATSNVWVDEAMGKFPCRPFAH